MEEVNLDVKRLQEKLFNKKENGANLSILDKLNLMKSMQSDEYKKEIIFNVNKRKELGIKSYQIKDLIKKAKVITIASSPFFIEQDYAIKVLKELFNCDII